MSKKSSRPHLGRFATYLDSIERAAGDVGFAQRSPGDGAITRGLQCPGSGHEKGRFAAGDSAPLDPAALQDPKEMVPSALPNYTKRCIPGIEPRVSFPGGSVLRGSSGRASYGI